MRKEESIKTQIKIVTMILVLDKNDSSDEFVDRSKFRLKTIVNGCGVYLLCNVFLL
jgi:hypothetical protein